MKRIILILLLFAFFSCDQNNDEITLGKSYEFQNFKMTKVKHSYYDSGYDVWIIEDNKTGQCYIGTLSGSFIPLLKKGEK